MGLAIWSWSPGPPSTFNRLNIKDELSLHAAISNLDGKLVARAIRRSPYQQQPYATKTTVRSHLLYLYPAVLINRGTSP